MIGSPVGHSGSPAMYNYSFARTGVDAAYLAFDIPLEQVQAGVEALKTLHVGGFNVTMPDQTAVAGLADEISPAAKLIGACNTVTVSVMTRENVNPGNVTLQVAQSGSRFTLYRYYNGAMNYSTVSVY